MNLILGTILGGGLVLKRKRVFCDELYRVICASSLLLVVILKMKDGAQWSLPKVFDLWTWFWSATGRC